MNSISKKATAILVVAICSSTIDAQACGEVMYRMGGALRYHAFVTRHPANIVLYSGPAARARFSGTETNFRENLEKAGHKVTVVQDPEGLATALAAHPYDVVIAYAGDLDGVSSQIAKASREPTLIPVVDRAATNKQELRERFPRVVSDDANLNQFLKVIEQSMKAREPDMSHSRPHVRVLHGVAVWLLLGAFAPFAPAHAQADEAWVPGKGHGSISFAYQDLYVQYHTNWRGWRGKPGVIDNHALLLGFEYGLTDRLAVNVNLPYRNIRYRGSLHNDIEGDHDENTLDDGDYHSGWADVGLGLRYQWRDEPWAITPYVVLGTPMRDYATYAHAAPGSGQSRLELGVNVGRAFGNLYLHGSLGYAFMEVVDDRRVDHAALTLGADYFVTPMLTARVGMTANKTFNGLDFPIDYPGFPNHTDEHFFHHDQNLRNDFVNVGVGLNYQLGDRYEVFANYGWSVWGENTHLVDNVATVGMARSF